MRYWKTSKGRNLVPLLFTAIKLFLTLAKLLLVFGKLAWSLSKLVLRVGLGLLGTITGRSARGVSAKTAVQVRRDWNDHRIGQVRWSELENPRWDTVAGGTQIESPKPLVHAYVWCNKVKGDIAHSCAHGPGPHNIKVCVMKQDNNKDVWNRLIDIVGPQQP